MDDDDIQDYVRPWVGLTDKELNVIGSQWHFNLLDDKDKTDLFEFARAIEAKLKDTNTSSAVYTTSQMAKDSFVEANMKRTQMLRSAMDKEHKYMNYREAFPKRENVMPVDRNEVLEEVAKAVYSFKAFEKDTMDSFVAYIRSMKQ